MKQWLGGCFCVLLSGLALAAPGTATKRVVEASTLVTGMIVIAPDGSVRSHAVDQPEKLTLRSRPSSTGRSRPRDLYRWSSTARL